MGGQGSGRPKSQRNAGRRHGIIISDRVWDKVVDAAGGERAVSRFIETILVIYFAFYREIKNEDDTANS